LFFAPVVRVCDDVVQVCITIEEPEPGETILKLTQTGVPEEDSEELGWSCTGYLQAKD